MTISSLSVFSLIIYEILQNFGLLSTLPNVFKKMKFCGIGISSDFFL